MKTIPPLLILGLLSTVLIVNAEESCVPVATAADFEDRFGRAPSARSSEDLAGLLENPTLLHAGAEHTDGPNGATIDIMTETHVVYPVRVSDLARVFAEDAPLPEYMPNLAEHEIICRPAADISRTRQRIDFGPMIFSLGTEYIIDVQHLAGGPEVYANRWILVDSLDGRLAYNYGSWYYEAVEIDGQPATYVHHYARTGLTTRVPGVRFFADRRAGGGVIEVLEAAFSEATRRFGRTDGHTADVRQKEDPSLNETPG